MTSSARYWWIRSAPVFHDAIRPPEFNAAWWPPYVETNERFARSAARIAGKGDAVWVHDYHLMLVPAMLRELRPDLRIGFFLHIPFPPEELFEWLPQRTELLHGLLGADIIGFQTRGAGQNFIRLAKPQKLVGICFGQALKQALGDKAGVRRYGHFTLPMEETLATVAIDLSGRYALVFKADFPSQKIGEFDSELVEDFWQAAAANALCNLHILVHYGRNSHHIAEAIFKSTARALRMATESDPRVSGIPSTKGSL